MSVSLESLRCRISRHTSSLQSPSNLVAYQYPRLSKLGKYSAHTSYHRAKGKRYAADKREYSPVPSILTQRHSVGEDYSHHHIEPSTCHALQSTAQQQDRERIFRSSGTQSATYQHDDYGRVHRGGAPEDIGELGPARDKGSSSQVERGDDPVQLGDLAKVAGDPW